MVDMDPIRSEWKEDKKLKEDISQYVKQNLRRMEILDYVSRDFNCYDWSLPTLARRMKHFGIKYINEEVSVEEVVAAVNEELKGPGKLLGYRAMHMKLRVEHDLKVPRNLVYNVMRALDKDGIDARSVKKRAKKVKKPFVSGGSDWLYSLDGHDKLMGFQNWTFPIAIYGCLDTFSRKVLYLFVWNSNSDPVLIANCYWRYICKTKKIPNFLRIDKGTETGKLATMQAFLMDSNSNDAAETVIYGPSTSNKIERWWRDLHERMEKFFKHQLCDLLETNDYNPHNPLDRFLLSYIFIPVIQNECNIFADLWNTHRIRKQKGLELPTGIPNHMYSFPHKYGGDQHGISVTEDMLQEVAELSGIMEAPTSYIDEEIKQHFEDVLPNPVAVESSKVAQAFRFVKSSLKSGAE